MHGLGCSLLKSPAPRSSLGDGPALALRRRSGAGMAALSVAVLVGYCLLRYTRHAIVAVVETCDHEVWVIRHGEKTVNASEGTHDRFHLNATGAARAAHLAQLVGDSRWPAFTAVFASNPRAPPYVLREAETVGPLAQLLGLRVNTSFAQSEGVGLAQAALAAARAQCGVVLICWEHCRIPGLLQALGCTALDCVGCWADGVYERVIRLRADSASKQVRLLSPTTEGFAVDPAPDFGPGFECADAAHRPLRCRLPLGA